MCSECTVFARNTCDMVVVYTFHRHTINATAGFIIQLGSSGIEPGSSK